MSGQLREAQRRLERALLRIDRLTMATRAALYDGVAGIGTLTGDAVDWVNERAEIELNERAEIELMCLNVGFRAA